MFAVSESFFLPSSWFKALPVFCPYLFFFFPFWVSMPLNYPPESFLTVPLSWMLKLISDWVNNCCKSKILKMGFFCSRFPDFSPKIQSLSPSAIIRWWLSLWGQLPLFWSLRCSQWTSGQSIIDISTRTSSSVRWALLGFWLPASLCSNFTIQPICSSPFGVHRDC